MGSEPQEAASGAGGERAEVPAPFPGAVPVELVPDGPLADDVVGPDFVAAVRADVASVELDGEVVVYDAAGERSHLLSPTAGLIFGCLDGVSTLAEVAADLAEAFHAPEAAVLEGVVSTVLTLGRQGLLAGVAGETSWRAWEVPLGPMGPDEGDADGETLGDGGGVGAGGPGGGEVGEEGAPRQGGVPCEREARGDG